MSRFRVTGSSEADGNPASLVIPAEDEDRARARANAEGIRVKEIILIDDDEISDGNFMQSLAASADPALVRSVRNANALLVGGFGIVSLVFSAWGDVHWAYSFILVIPGFAMAGTGGRILNQIICQLAKENRNLRG